MAQAFPLDTVTAVFMNKILTYETDLSIKFENTIGLDCAETGL